jgi:hypothetical protein
MSDQDLDKLFKNKLEDLQESPSSEAWSRINSGLHTRRFPLFKVAAAIAILTIAGGLVWYSLPKPGEMITESQQSVPESTVPSIQPEVDSESERQAEEILAPKTQLAEESTVTKSQPADKADNKELIALSTLERIPSPKPETKENPAPAIDEILSEQPEIVDLPKEKVSVEQEALVTGQTLSFSISDFENTQNTALNDAEEDEGLKKVWGILKQVKEPQAGFGELRELKNNILAFGKTKKEKE